VYERPLESDLGALEVVVAEQLHLFRHLAGTDPTHLDSHQHAHRRDPLQSIMRRLAAHLGVPLRHFARLLCCHPAAETDFQSPCGKERLKELRGLCSPVVRHAIQCSGVVLASFAHLKRLVAIAAPNANQDAR
jgi:chitin disaccharide deacetylase